MYYFGLKKPMRCFDTLIYSEMKPINVVYKITKMRRSIDHPEDINKMKMIYLHQNENQ